MTMIERTNYFAGEALLTDDFVCEQRYHIEMLRRNNEALHTPGIAHGLGVYWDPGNSANQVTVLPGLALDADGHEIILLGQTVVPLDGADDGTSYFLTIRYHEAYADYSCEGGAAGYKRVVLQPLIEWHRNMPDPDRNILLAVLDRDKSGNITGLSYKAGGAERRYVGSVLGSLRFVDEGAGLARSRSASTLAGFIEAPLTASATISARRETGGNASYLQVEAARVAVSGVLSTGGNLGVGVDQPGASLHVDATVFSGGGNLASSDGRNITFSRPFQPFLDIGDVIISDPTVNAASQRYTVLQAHPDKKLVVVERTVAPQLNKSTFTYVRSTLARYTATNAGQGSLLEINIDGTVGLGRQAGTNDGKSNPGMSALVVTPERQVGIGLTSRAPGATLDVGGPIAADSLSVSGDITTAGRVVANSFEGNGEKLKNLPNLGYWNKDPATSALSYNGGNVGIRTRHIQAALSVGGGRAFVGNGLISVKARDTTKKTITITGYQTMFTRQVNVGDTISAGKVIPQRRVVAKVNSATELILDEQFAIPVIDSSFSTVPAGGDPDQPAPGQGTIVSNGTTITGSATSFTTGIQPGDTLVIDKFEQVGTGTWYVKLVPADNELVLSVPAEGTDTFEAIASAFAVTPALLGAIQSDGSTTPAMLIATNTDTSGNGGRAPNTVAINVPIDELDGSYALQVNGAVNFGNDAHFDTLTANEATIGTSNETTANITEGNITMGTITTGNITTGNIKVANLLQSTVVQGSFDATAAAVKMMGGAQSIGIGPWGKPACYQPPVDGYVIGTVSYPSDYSVAALSWLVAWANGVTVHATGGNLDVPDGWVANNSNSFILPVPAGATFAIACQVLVGQTPVSAWWIPLGNSGGNLELVQLESIPNDQPPPQASRRPTVSPAGVVAALEKITGKVLDASKRAEVLAALAGT